MDNRSGLEIQNVSRMAYDDGHGNIKGMANGKLNYSTGEIIFTGPANANFVISANYGSSQSGGNRFGTDEGNCLEAIRGRSLNAKINTSIEVIGLQ